MANLPPQTPLAITTGTGADMLKEILGSYDEYELRSPFGEVVFVQRFEVGGVGLLHANRHSRDQRLTADRYILAEFLDHRHHMTVLRQCGARRIIGTSLVGGVEQNQEPGQVILPYQCITPPFGKLSFARPEDGPEFYRGFPNPFSGLSHPELNQRLKEQGLFVQVGGTLEVVRGPKFETKADIIKMRTYGVTIAGMLTVLPEAFLGDELGMVITPVCLISDLPFKGAKQEEVIAVAKVNMPKIIRAIANIIPWLNKQGTDDLPKPVEGLLKRFKIAA
ncbi:MAG: hypothetical protein ABII24_03180 [bacterium]